MISDLRGAFMTPALTMRGGIRAAWRGHVVHIVCVCVAAVCGLSTATTALAVGYSFAALGVSGFADDVSADGSVMVGGWNYDRAFRAFRWTNANGIADLGRIHGGDGNSISQGASADGTVIVGFDDYGKLREAFLWTSDGGMTGLGDLSGEGFYSQALGVSADGLTVVGESNSSSGNEAFRWTIGEGMHGLGDLPGGRFQSWANNASADGSVIVGVGTSDTGLEAARWFDSKIENLGHLPGGVLGTDGVVGVAYDVSADGNVIVGSAVSSSGREAFRWTREGGMVGLGDLPGGRFYSEGFGISADGSVIVGRGSTTLGASGDEAFIWTEARGMVSLQQLLIDCGVPGLDGWSLLQATGISDDGRTIVGTANGPNGSAEAFIVTIPEPPGLALTVIAALVVWVGRCMRRAICAGKTASPWIMGMLQPARTR